MRIFHLLPVCHDGIHIIDKFLFIFVSSIIDIIVQVKYNKTVQ